MLLFSTSANAAFNSFFVRYFPISNLLSAFYNYKFRAYYSYLRTCFVSISYQSLSYYYISIFAIINIYFFFLLSFILYYSLQTLYCLVYTLNNIITSRRYSKQIVEKLIKYYKQKKSNFNALILTQKIYRDSIKNLQD